MTSEGIVVAAVEHYFSQPKFQKFSTKQEYSIKMGSDKRRADVVLMNSKGNLAAIAECKRPGVEGDGIDQLKSYLSATDTSLGVFANSTEPDSWNFYENLGRNRFREITTRSEFEKQVVKSGNNFVTRVLNFFSQFLRPKPDNIKSDDRKPTGIEIDGESAEPILPVISPKRHIDSIIPKDRPLQNEHSENTVEPSLNGNPYYSEENGFYWAANHQGIAECVPQHIKRIIHNEELEIASTRDELEQEINYLREEAIALEEQKHTCEQEIEVRSQALAKKKEELAGLEVQLKALAITTSEPLITEATSDNPDSELFDLPAGERTSGDPIIKPFEEEINDLIQEKTEIIQAIDAKSEALARKKEEFAKLEVELDSPTATELNPIPADTASHNDTSVNHEFSRLGFVSAIISTFFFVCLAIYLFIFYASAVDKAFFLNTEAIQAQLEQGTYAGVNDVVNPKALFKVFQGEWNLFVLMFPFIFLAFAIALDYFWETGKQWIAVVLALLTLVFDSILAIQISQKIHQAKILMGQETEQWAFSLYDLNMWTVIFCGFVVSLLVSIIYHVMNHRWKAISPAQEHPKTSDLRELKINSEKTQRQVGIAVLKTEMDNLQSEISQLKEKDTAAQEKIGRAVKTPIETQVVVLKVEMDNLQGNIDQLADRNTVLHQKIEEADTKIAELSSQRNKRVVNRNKMESQVNQFLNGWCRFVAHSENGVSDISTRIDRIKQISKDTLDHYYRAMPDDSAHP